MPFVGTGLRPVRHGSPSLRSGEGFRACPVLVLAMNIHFFRLIFGLVGVRIYPVRANKRQVPVFEAALAGLSGR